MRDSAQTKDQRDSAQTDDRRDRAQPRLQRAGHVPDARLQRAKGRAELGFAAGVGGGRSALSRLFQATPCRVLLPRPEPDDLVTGVLATTCGGLTGGDSLRLALAAEAGARAVVTTQAAEKIYRSLGGDSVVEVSLAVGAGAWLEWLPQETILFDGSRLVRRNEAAVAPGGRLLAAEMLVFGRTAHGERFARGRLRESWRVRRAGRLAWADGIRLDGDIARILDHPAGFDGAVASATALYVADDAPRRLDTARGLIGNAACRAAATLVNGVLLTRFLGRDARAVRLDLMAFVAGMRSALAGLPARLPRVWTT